MSHGKKVFSDTVIYLIAKILEGVIGIYTLSVLTRILSTQNFGHYVILNTTLVSISLVSTLWLTQSFYRYYSQFENNKEKLYSTIFILFVVTSVFISLPFILLLQFFNISFYVPTIAYVAFLSHSLVQFIIALVSARRLSKMMLGISLFISVCRVLLIKTLEPTIYNIFFSYFVSDFLVILYTVAKLRIFQYISVKNFDRKVFSSIKLYGVPLVFSFLTSTILNNSDRYIIKHFFDESAVAIYFANYTIASSAFTMINTAFMRGSYPTILALYSNKEEEKAKVIISKVIHYYIGFSVPALVGLFMIHPYISVILDSKYSSGSFIIFVIGASLVVNFFYEFSNKYFELSSNTKKILYFNFLGASINIGLNFLLLRHFDYTFASMTTLIGFLLCFLVSRFTSRKYIKWEINKTYVIKIITSSLFMGLVLRVAISVLDFTLGYELVLLIFIGVLSYIVGVVMTGAFKDEFKTLKLKKYK